MKTKFITSIVVLNVCSTMSYAADIDCTGYIKTTESVMQERQNGKNIRDLVNLAKIQKDNARTPDEIELSNLYTAFTIIASNEPIGQNDQEKEFAIAKAKYIGESLCKKYKQK